VKLTRILLPAQLCFFAGGVFGSVLLVRKQFSVQAVAPLIYGLGTSWAACCWCGAWASLRWPSVRWREPLSAVSPELDLRAPGGTRYRQFSIGATRAARVGALSLPLMVGVSLVTFDTWIILHFAANTQAQSL